MKWLILSDSHGVISNMKQAVIRSSPDGILHLGDCWQDGQRLHQLFPQLPFYQVPGNCDFRPDVPSERPRSRTWIFSSLATPTVPWWTGEGKRCF